jgi:hypothetical protein
MKLKIKYLGFFLMLITSIGCEENTPDNLFAPQVPRSDQTIFDDINSTYPIQNTFFSREKVIPLECNSSLVDIRMVDVNDLQGYTIYAYQKKLIAYKEDEEYRADVTYDGLPKNISTDNIIMDLEHDIITDYRKIWIQFNCDGSFKFSGITDLSGSSSRVRVMNLIGELYFDGITKEVEVFHDFGLSLFFKGDTEDDFYGLIEKKGYISLKNDKDIKVCDSLLYFPTIPLTIGKIEKVATCY